LNEMTLVPNRMTSKSGGPDAHLVQTEGLAIEVLDNAFADQLHAVAR
jgi:hypothetical protein